MWVALSILAALLALHVAAASYLYLRCHEREGLLRHLRRRSSVLALYNAAVYAFSALPCRPVLDASVFPELDPLRARWRELRDEALAARDRITPAAYSNDPAIQDFNDLGWSRFYLKWHGPFLPSARTAFPRTVELLRDLPGVLGAMFAILPAGARLGAHTDPFAGGLRYHLGLQASDSPECSIDIDGQRYRWRDGQVLVFDETYLHALRNDTDRDRLILICDVERPLRFAWATAIHRVVRGAMMKATAIQNVDSDPVGLASRAFGVLAWGARHLRPGSSGVRSRT